MGDGLGVVLLVVLQRAVVEFRFTAKLAVFGGGAQVLFSRVKLAVFRLQLAQTAERLDVVGAQRKRFAERIFCFFAPVAAVKQHADVEMCVGPIRTQADRQAIFLLGAFIVAEVEAHVAEAAMAIGIAGVQNNRLAKREAGFVQPVLPPQQATQAGGPSGRPRRDRHTAAEMPFGFVGTIGDSQELREVGVRHRVRRLRRQGAAVAVFGRIQLAAVLQQIAVVR